MPNLADEFPGNEGLVQTKIEDLEEHQDNNGRSI